MNLVENWRSIAARSHSMWANYLGLAALLTPEAIYSLTGRDTDPRGWFWAGIILLFYACIGRVLNQGVGDGTKRKAKTAFLPAILALGAILLLSACSESDQQSSDNGTPSEAVAAVETVEALPDADPFDALAVDFIGKWEGLRLAAYKDIVGIWTVCYGETKGVKLGDVYTKAQCDDMLAERVQDFRNRLRPHFVADTIAVRLPTARDVAYTSLAYNAGVGAIGKSTAVRRLNGGDIEGGCEALGWWNKAGGRVIRGLVRRRTEEQALCRQDLPTA